LASLLLLRTVYDFINILIRTLAHPMVYSARYTHYSRQLKL